jgi:hypothetical protein
MDDFSAQAAISLLGIILTAVVTYYFSQRKYTFEKTYDRKLAYLEEIYGKVISLEKDLKRYVHTTGAEMSDESLSRRREQIAPIQEKFFELQEYFWKKEITLDESSCAAIQSFIDTSIEIMAKLQTSIVSSRVTDHNTAFDQWDGAYQIMKDKLQVAKGELKKDFRRVTSN